MNILGIKWQDSTVGHTETAEKSGTLEEMSASTIDRKLEIASDVDESRIRISARDWRESMSNQKFKA